MTDISIPEGLWDTDRTPEGIVANWFYQTGSKVEEGDTVAELMVEKTSYDITAPASGTLTRMIEKDGIVTPGMVIGTIG